MSQIMTPWDTSFEPDEYNISTWMRNFYDKVEPMEQARWNQGNIDTLFVAGEQRFINSYFNFYPTTNGQNFYFNFIQQPINMVTGYQRQHRKSINYTPIEGSKQTYADDATKVVTYANNYRNILEKFSRSCEESTVAGMVLMQPYLDYTDDPVNGTLDLKLWSYNSFITDSFWREPDMSDANVIWCQQYLSKREAISKFPRQRDRIRSMSGFANREGKFYFLPENQNLARNDMLVLSHIWYKSHRIKKMLYNNVDGITYEFGRSERELEELVEKTGIFEILDVETPTWKLAVVLNDQMMYNGKNPMGFDECPMIPNYWNYDPQIAQYDLRVRSLTRSMRDSQFLLNRRVILNHDISECSINAGYKRKENAVANEEDLRYSGQGKDIIIKDGYEMTDIEKIIPNAVPASDIQLADQLVDFIFRTSGVNQEMLGMAQDSKTGIEVMLRQGAGLVTLQKYFDQWDVALKLLGKRSLSIIQNRWSPTKIARIIGRKPDPEFETGLFTKMDVLVSEGLNTTIQQQQQFMQMIQLNEVLGGIIPPKFILDLATIQGKKEIIEAVEAQQQQAAAIAHEEQILKQTLIQTELQHMQAKSASELALAHERHGRAESNIGLFEERLSQISQNQSVALKDKITALKTLLEAVSMYGISPTEGAHREIEKMGAQISFNEDIERVDAKRDSSAAAFMSMSMQNNRPNPMMGLEQSTRSALL